MKNKKSNIHILSVDDDAAYRQLMVDCLLDEGYTVHQAGDGTEAIDVINKQPIALVLLDMNMPGKEGNEILPLIKSQPDPIEVIVISGQQSIEVAVEALHLGAYHYLTKPVDLGQLITFVERALDHRRIVYEHKLMRANRSREKSEYPIICVSDAMRHVMNEARQAATLDANVLISGETGVGKEVISSLIHAESDRHQGPFNAINCGAIPENLIDSEFFGYEKGAFTGADQMKPGIIEMSSGGTLLLDEIGDIVEMAQVRLLRFLESGLIRRVGGSKEIPVDVRVLAASHRNLKSLVDQGEFRADLFHRLNVIPIHIPALRERSEDIVPLAEAFLDILCSKYGNHRYLSEDTHEALLHYPWPGNIRELRNVLERSWYNAERAGAEAINVHHLHLNADQISTDTTVAPSSTVTQDFSLSLKEKEEEYICQVLEHCKQHRAEAAKVLGMTERSLYRRLQKMN